MADLTERELHFLWSQGVDESEVLDCTDMSSRRYKGAMENEGYLFCIAPSDCYRSQGCAVGAVTAFSATQPGSRSSDATTQRPTFT